MSSSVLKIIACLTMLCDHLAYGLKRGGYLINTGFPCVYTVMRMIGRIAFPIFIFMIVEGAKNTRNKTNYALRLGAFALISEIPFDMLLKGKFFYFGGQNVMFTLLIGLLCVYAEIYSFKKGGLFGVITTLVSAGVGYVLAEYVIKCDYGGIGVLAVAAMGLYAVPREKIEDLLGDRTARFAAALIMCLILASLSLKNKGSNEYVCILSLVPIMLYNGQRGFIKGKLKWLFYAFYPAHIGIIGYLMMRFPVSVLYK